MGRFGSLLFFLGTVVVSSKASTVWQYNIPEAYRDYGIPIGIAQRPCDYPALTIEAEPIAVEEFHPLPEVPEGPKLGELSLSEVRLPAAPAFQEVYAPLVEIPKLPELPAFTLPEFREEEPKKEEEEPRPIQLANIPEAPTLPIFSLPASAVKIDVPEPALPVYQPPALPSFTYEIPEKYGEPAVVPCGILELPSYSPAQAISQNSWNLLTNFAPAPVPEWSAPLEEVRINEISQSPEFTPEIVIATEPKPEPVKLASIPEAPVLSPFVMPELPATIAIEQPAPLSEIPALPALSLPSYPTRVIVEQAALPCSDNIFSAPAVLPALPEMNINTIEEAYVEKAELVHIPAAPILPEFTFPVNIELEAAKLEPVPELPKLPELPTLPFHELPARIEERPCDSAEPIIVQEVQLEHIPEGPVLPEFSLPEFSAKVEIEEPAYYAPAPAPVAPEIYVPLANIPEAPMLGGINLEEIRLPEIRLPEISPVAPETYVPIANIPEAPMLGEINLEEIRLPEIRLPEIETSTPCSCENKAESAPAYVPEYPAIRLPEIDYRFNPIITEPEHHVVVAVAPEYASYYSPKYCVENIVKQRVLPNLINGPKHEFVVSIPNGPHLSAFNSLPVV